MCFLESRSLSWSQAKNDLFNLVMTSVKSKVPEKGSGACEVLGLRFSPETTRTLGRKKSNEGFDSTAAVGVNINSPFLAGNELSPHLVGNP